MPKTISIANNNCWNESNLDKLHVFLHLIQNKAEDFFIANNGFFIQLIYHGLKCNNERVKHLAVDLYNKYLGFTRILAIKEHIDDTLYVWTNDLTDNFMFIFYSQQDVTSRAFVVTKKYMNDFYNKILKDWSLNYYYENNQYMEDKENKTLTEIFDHFQVFELHYRYVQNMARFKKLIELLELGGDNTIKFTQALNSKWCSDKLVGFAEQDVLNTQMVHLFKDYDKLEFRGYTQDHSRICLSDVALGKIMKGFYLQGTNNITIKAATFLILSALFMFYSSSRMFGTENDSPLIIRYFAYALMRQAHDFAPEIFSKNDLKNNYEEWTGKLLGKSGSFTCTAILSGDVRSYCKTNFAELSASIIPLAWYNL